MHNAHNKNIIVNIFFIFFFKNFPIKVIKKPLLNHEAGDFSLELYLQNDLIIINVKFHHHIIGKKILTQNVYPLSVAGKK